MRTDFVVVVATEQIWVSYMHRHTDKARSHADISPTAARDCDDNNNNNNNSSSSSSSNHHHQLTMFMVLLLWQIHRESLSGLSDEIAPSDCRPSDPVIRLALWVRLSAAIVYTHHCHLLCESLFTKTETVVEEQPDNETRHDQPSDNRTLLLEHERWCTFMCSNYRVTAPGISSVLSFLCR